jgi:hypothetical protein
MFDLKKLFVYFSMITSMSIFAQQDSKSPVTWTFEVKPNTEGKFEFSAVAKIEKDWNIYSVYMEEGGPIPTSFTFENLDGSVLDGKIVELSKSIKVHDDLFEMDVIKFKDTAKFSQLIAGKKGAMIQGTVEYMCCDSKRCLPPTVKKFNLSL